MNNIQINNVSKFYKTYERPAMRLLEWLSVEKKKYHEQKYVLRDINLTLNQGESIGIIGVNGAGKSTLLKLITGVIRPSSGKISVSGQISAILELGMGFHPDFTGRQNALMSGQLMGFTHEDMAKKFSEIEAFAEIGSYIDQPVRVYSSGMQVRLAFAVATVHRPDILIVDEALAVGDIYFQQKCYKLIKDYIKQGMTLIFVTHGMGTVLEICDRVIYLREGRVVFDGKPKTGVDFYQADMLELSSRQKFSTKVKGKKEAIRNDTDELEIDEASWQGSDGSLLTNKVMLKGVSLTDENNCEINTVICDQRVSLKIHYSFSDDLSDPHVGFKIRNKFGNVIFETNTFCMNKQIKTVKLGEILETEFSFSMSIYPGDYTVTVGLANKGYGGGLFEEYLNYAHDVMSIKVLPNPDGIIWDGIINLNPHVSFVKGKIDDLKDAYYKESI